MKITTSLLKPCSDTPGWWALTRLSLCTNPHLVPCQIALAFPINIFTARMIIWGNWEIRVFPRNPILDVQMWGYVEVTCGLWEGQELPRRSCLPTPEQFFYWNICQTAEFNCFGHFLKPVVLLSPTPCPVSGGANIPATQFSILFHILPWVKVKTVQFNWGRCPSPIGWVLLAKDRSPVLPPVLLLLVLVVTVYCRRRPLGCLGGVQPTRRSPLPPETATTRPGGEGAGDGHTSFCWKTFPQ